MAADITGVRKRNLYDPASGKPFRLSRSRLDLFLNCPRCFYLDRRLGVDRPRGPPFTLNLAVDELLKREFDNYRRESKPHPIMTEYGVDAVPYADKRLDEWRQNFKGVTYHHLATNLIITGAVDDLWINPSREILVVDYKATSKDGAVTLDAAWQIAYKRQMEIYQWLLRHNDLTVSSTGYFLYCNGRKDRDGFDGRLEFRLTLIPYEGDDAWIEQTVVAAHECLNSADLPGAASSCDFCSYRDAAHYVEMNTPGQRSLI